MRHDKPYLAVIKFEDRTALYFGPFDSYEEADDFAQKKFFEYKQAQCAYVDGLCEPILFPGRSV